MTAQELANAYVEAINSPPNGWGQHYHPTLGRSDSILMRLYVEAGYVEGSRLINEAIKKTTENAKGRIKYD